jgi:hypothetical protein
MMQLLDSMPKRGNITDLQLECLNRTFWGCFVMDRLVFCGKSQPPSLPLHSMETHWPVGQRDFAFGQACGQTYLTGGHEKPAENAICNDIDGYYALLVKGYDIWAQILKWITGGGRRRPDLCAGNGIPWSGKSTWRSLYDQLQVWRRSHGSRIRFPDSPVEVHISLGHGHAFAYINLLYYIR